MKTKLLIILLFLLVNSAVYIITNINKTSKIDLVLKKEQILLDTHYKILLETQKKVSLAVYKSTLKIDRFFEIMREANGASKEKKAKLRKELENLLEGQYEIAKLQGVLQYQFVFPNNKSFYRAHKKDKFGDDLTDVRADFKYTNETLKPTRGFVQGRTTPAFRNTFPIFDENNQHLGAMEVSFSSNNFQYYLNNISKINSHFLVKKEIFNIKSWKKDNLIAEYSQSAESKDYLIHLNTLHTKEKYVNQSIKRLKSKREEIDSKILLGKPFTFYVKYESKFDIVSFMPIKNMKNKVIAWIVSYTNDKIIKATIEATLMVRVATFLLSLLILYFIFRQMKDTYIIKKKNLEIKKQHELLDDILNSTDNIIFITDFKDVKFSNDRFKEILNQSNNHHMLNIFISAEGYLHSGLLKDGEDFVSLISRTAPEDRVVSVLDKEFEPKAFKISISKSKNNGDYLVTLSDITKLKEKQVQIEKKAYMDGLTGVYNRNKFDEIFEEEIKNSKRYKTPLSVAILDIDKFKNFNDTYGHLIGDEVLITMAQTVNSNVRETDVFARWGGEEFVILFKNTTVDNAKEVSEKLKDNIQENNHPAAGKITASFGVTEYIDGDTVESIFKRCDDALYIAKENGRNRVEVL